MPARLAYSCGNSGVCCSSRRACSRGAPDKRHRSLGQRPLLSVALSDESSDWCGLGDNTSHLRPSPRKLRGERIKQGNKIEKLILRLKGRRWRHLALLGFMLVVDLLDLTSVDAQATLGQDVLGHLVPQACQERRGGLLGLPSVRASEIISVNSKSPSVKLRRSGSNSASTAACASKTR